MLEKRAKNLDQLLKLYIKELEKVIRVEKVYLFGSYAAHKERDYSDIDIAVISPDFEGGTEKDYLILGRAALKIYPLIEARPYRPEDIKTLSSLDFLSEILNKGKLIYDKAA
ncbi:MAG: nucleotidyltransferase domain-containing protein [Pseudomonadota bacterium]